MVRVLFVDDDRRLQETLSASLKRVEIEVVGADSVSGALKFLGDRRRHFDAVLLEIALPPPAGVSGEEVGYGRETGVYLAGKIGEMRPGLPMVAYTIVRDEDILRRAHEAGIDEILQKPASVSRVVAALWWGILTPGGVFSLRLMCGVKYATSIE